MSKSLGTSLKLLVFYYFIMVYDCVQNPGALNIKWHVASVLV